MACRPPEAVLARRIAGALACRLLPNPKLARVPRSVLGLPDSVGTSGRRSFPALSGASLPLHHSPMISWGFGLLSEQACPCRPSIHASETAAEAPVPLVTLLSALCRFYDPAGPENKEEGSTGSSDQGFHPLHSLGNRLVLALQEQACSSLRKRPSGRGSVGQEQPGGWGLVRRGLGGSLARRVMVPDVLQDVHLIHMAWICCCCFHCCVAHSLRWTSSGGHGWLSGQRWQAATGLEPRLD